jgi:MoaA/NifB/PqqE/SkfB family radical SAM enzyme
MNVYSHLKVFHYHEKLITLSPETSKIHALIHVRIKPTNTCNHHYDYCPYQSNEELQLGTDMFKKDQIPHDKMMEIVEDCIEMKVAAVTFSGGGEPFCYPHLAKSAQKLSEAGIRIASLTNGGRLTGEAAEVFAQLGTWIRVSMDGWDVPSYAKFRKVHEREYQKILDNMKAFKKLGGNLSLGSQLYH